MHRSVSGYRTTIGNVVYHFEDLKTLLAKASPARSGDELAGISAASAEERVAAQMALADVPLKTFLSEPVVPYESDEVTRLIVDQHDAAAFAPVAHLTVGDFRDWLLSEQATGEILAALAPGLTPEMAAAVSKTHAGAGPGHGSGEDSRGHALPQHARAGRAAFDAAAAQSSDRRSQGHRRQHHRRSVATEAATR